MLAACNRSSAVDLCSSPTTIVDKRVVPPAENPYPPTTPADGKRVRLAEATVHAFFGTRLDEAGLRGRARRPHDHAFDDTTKGPDAFHFADKEIDCVGDVECWSGDYPFLLRAAGLASLSPPRIVSKVRWSHVIPWAMKRYEERGLPVESRHYADALRMQEAQTRDYAGTSDPDAFAIALPSLRDDEYLVDSVIELRSEPGYFHVMCMMTDDPRGEPALRWFDTMPVRDVTHPSCYR